MYLRQQTGGRQFAELSKVYKIVAPEVKTGVLSIDSCFSEDKSIHLASRELVILPK
jgi:hypothetical protein